MLLGAQALSALYASLVKPAVQTLIAVSLEDRKIEGTKYFTNTLRR